MPFKIGSSVVSFHRPEALKQARPGDKEQLNATDLASPALRPRAGRKPLVEVSRASPYTRYLSVDAVNRAIAALPPTQTLSQLVTQMRAHLAAHRASRGEPSVLIIGDLHGTPCSVASVLVALHDMAAPPRAKRLLLEFDAAAMRTAFPEDPAQRRQYRRALRRNDPLEFQTENPTHVNMFHMGLYAKHLGYDVSGHDALGDSAQDRTERENAMLASIAGSLVDAATTIVVTGSHHVPELHDKLAGRAGVLAMAALDPVVPGDHEQVKRFSHLLSTPGILCINPGPGLLDGPPLDATRFINALL